MIRCMRESFLDQISAQNQYFKQKSIIIGI